MQRHVTHACDNCGRLVEDEGEFLCRHCRPGPRKRYRVVTRWTSGTDGATFTRKHERYALHAEDALQLERVHNAARFGRDMDREDQWSWEILSCDELT